MPMLAPAMVAAALAAQGQMAWAQTHSASPGSSNTANVNTGGRVAAVWTTPTDAGNFNLSSSIDFSGLAANAPVAYVTFWTASSGGSCSGVFPTAGDATANSSGEVSLTAIPLTGIAT